MATQARARGASAGGSGGVGLRILAVLLGVFLIAVGASTIAWVADSSVLLARFQQWLPAAAPAARWYLETVCIPGAPLFARLVPIGAFGAGVALVVGFWTRMAAIATFLMVLSFHVASSALWAPAFLRDGTGLPVLGGLLALAIGGSRLPFSVDRKSRN